METRGQLSLSLLVLFLPPATKLGQGYVFTGVCDSVHRGGVPDQVPPRDQVHPPWDQVHPPRPGTPPRTRYTPLGPGTPPRDQVPPDQVHPPGPGTPPRDQGDTVYARAVRILLECILVCK